MASTSSIGGNGAKTRLKDATEKRRAEVELKEKEEIKRQKKMFAPRNLIGPRDILANSNLPKIKLEEDVGSSSIVKREPLDAESTSVELQNGLGNSSLPEMKPEVDDGFVVEVEETLDIESTFTGHSNEVDDLIEQNENLENEVYVEHKVFSSVNDNQNVNLPKVFPESEDNKITKDPIKVVEKKNQEVCVLTKLIDRLQIRLEQINSDGSSPNRAGSSPHFDNPQIEAQLTTDLERKDQKTTVLCSQMLKLQSEIYAKLLGRSFKKVLPILYPELQLNDTLDCRSESICWETAVKTFLVEMGNLPTWNEPALHKLPKVYRFTEVQQLDTFSTTRKGKVVISKLFFDNISIESIVELKIIKPFLITFGVHIKYLKIRQCVYVDGLLSQIKAEKLMDFVKFCLEKVPNLVGFSLIICKGKIDKTNKPNWWRSYLKHKTYDISERHTYAKLEKLESLVIDFEDFPYDFNLNYFATSLIDSYSKQLKHLSILADNLRKFEIEEFGRVNRLCVKLNVPNLAQLTIHQSFLSRDEFKCNNVEKCTIVNHDNELKHDDMILIQRVFPKLTCLGLNFPVFYWKSKFHDSLWNTSTPKLPNVLTLELKMCHNVTFSVLEGFPNLRYLKLIHDPPQLVLDSKDHDTCLHVIELFQGKSLYELQQFWEKFPSISLVTLELCKVEGKGTLTPKLYTYTRDGYVQFCSRYSQ